MEAKFQTLYDNNLNLGLVNMDNDMDVDSVNDSVDFIIHLTYIADFVGATINRDLELEQALVAYVGENF